METFAASIPINSSSTKESMLVKPGNSAGIFLESVMFRKCYQNVFLLLLVSFLIKWWFNLRFPTYLVDHSKAKIH